METKIGDIGNYYGSLSVMAEDGKFFWSIENYDGHCWDEITPRLYRALMTYEKKRLADLKKASKATKS